MKTIKQSNHAYAKTLCTITEINRRIYVYAEIKEVFNNPIR